MLNNHLSNYHSYPIFFCCLKWFVIIVALGQAAKLIAGTLMPYVLGWALEKFSRDCRLFGIIDMCHGRILCVRGKGLMDGWGSGE